MTDLLERGGCRWLTTFEHAIETGSVRKADKAQVVCCHCKTKIDYTQSWVTVPYGAHGNRLPLPVFVHCPLCAATLDPQAAFMSAWQKDKQAAEPDLDKVKREEALNAYLSQDIIEE